MGFLDKITALTGQFGGGEDAAKVGGGLMQELENSPGGVSGIVQSFQQNGLGGLVQQWGSGQTQGVGPEQIEQGLGNSAIIQNVAERTGMSPDAVKSGLATLMPLVISHCVSNGHITADGAPTGAPLPDSSSMLQSVLGKLI